MNEAQKVWASTPVESRLRLLKTARHHLAELAGTFAAAAAPELARTVSDTLASEVLPLLEAAKFLEQQAATLLRPRRLGRAGLPFWLSRIDSRVFRVPFGTVLVIGPSNYPLLLPGVQTLQALAAGNAVIWKPGRGGRHAADIFARALYAAGLSPDLLQVTDETVEAAERAIEQGVDKVFFTGSAGSGQVLLRKLASTLTPCVAELSGCDAVVVLPSAKLDRVVQALSFGMRLNGSSTCMAPRRVILVDTDDARRAAFLSDLRKALARVRGVPLSPSTRDRLSNLLQEARLAGATVIGEPGTELVQPVLVLNGEPGMAIAQADIFAPVLTILSASNSEEVLAVHDRCPYGLTASIFGEEQAARSLAALLTVGTVLINDLIVPTADPRVPFGGRRSSGYGVTRGVEGLLEMTAIKVVTTRRGSSTRHYDAPTELHDSLIGGIVRAAHARSLGQRWAGIRQTFSAGRRMKDRGR